MESRERNLANRDWLLQRLRAEIVGPDPAGHRDDAFAASGVPTMSWEEFRRPRRQADGEEILTQDRPAKRYGAGILFPAGVNAGQAEVTEEDREVVPNERQEPEQEPIDAVVPVPVAGAEYTAPAVDGADEEDVNLANAWNPSALGLTFLADLESEQAGFTVEVRFAVYADREVQIPNDAQPERPYARTVWLRQTGRSPEGSTPCLHISARDLMAHMTRRWVPGSDDRLQVVVVSRPAPVPNSAHRLVTVSLVNRQTRLAGPVDRSCFFQCGFQIAGDSGTNWIAAYPEASRDSDLVSDEELVLDLLYRDRRTFAIGHGCAADWPAGRPDAVQTIWTESLPSFDVTPVTADIIDSSGRPIRVSMRKLAGLDPRDDGREELEHLIGEYRRWIDDLRAETGPDSTIPTHLQAAGERLVSRCEQCLDRIRDGISFLESDEPGAKDARIAFRITNHAMLLSQLRSNRTVRAPRIDDGSIQWPDPPPSVEPERPHPDRGYWRAFQIAFLLMNLRSICQSDDPYRRTVELIWFPTGGGKTEAYLGLTAFTILFNRLTERGHTTDVLMRYTLRLLTTQQFQRAALLFCALEHIRRLPGHADRLGERPFRMGMWVGGTATPNTRQQARTALRNLHRDARAENPFVLLKCPWCHARLGPMELGQHGRGRRRRVESIVLGYEQVRHGEALTVEIRCSDPACEFGSDPTHPGKPPLPVVVVDEDLFDQLPNLVIGTVDKFAMLTWKPEVRCLFGLDEDGHQESAPPSLIIQDELHLISGPLGSMVGAFETLIEDLCVDRRAGTPIVPKIIASTATISRAESQARALYARERTLLFPPSGLQADDSFFAQVARDPQGNVMPGKRYSGVFAPGHGSSQTTLARVFASLLQYPAVMDVESEQDRDPWWTLLAFFNSLRELGNASTLLVADARDYLRVLVDRHGFPYGSIRQLLNCQELTSRVRSDQVPAILQALEKAYPPPKGAGLTDAPLEVCLASSIIEVGVDIDRLSLMLITGQPKTTSQYIQVSGRVGRRAMAPGLVVIVYNPGKPRDRSHYEHFRSYHHALYKRVEPTSVTPFSPPVVDRALHSLIVAAVRQLSSKHGSARHPRPFPLPPGSALRERIESVLSERARFVDPSEEAYLRSRLTRRLGEWQAWDPAYYGGFGLPPDDPPLIHPAGSSALPGWEGRSWPTLTSLRDVDATCGAEVTGFYNRLPTEDDA